MIEAEEALSKGQGMDDTRKSVVERALIHNRKAGPHSVTRDVGLLEEMFRLVCRHAGDSAAIRWFCDQGKYNSSFGLQVTQEVPGPLNENVTHERR